jgi:hypothetical protein
VRPRLAQRELALLAIALLAAVIVLALAVGRPDKAQPGALPAPVHWYAALAAPYAPPLRRRTACGVLVRRGTLGVAHPVLPCGVKIYLELGDKRVLTQVIDKGPTVPGREFDVTRALAGRIGLHGIQQVKWAYPQ